MSVEKFIDKLLDVKKAFDTMPYGIIMSNNVYQILKGYKNRYVSMVEIEDKRILQMPVYNFSDVPDDEAVVFYDKDKMDTYLEGRFDGLNHHDALLKSMGEVSMASMIENKNKGEE